MSGPAALQQVDGTYVLYHKQKLSYFSGCDYYRLSAHPDVLAASERTTREVGLNVAASRTTTGNHRLYQQLEKQLAHFFQVDSAVLFSNAYMANLAAAEALAGDFSHVLIDERAHVSLVDAARWFGGSLLRFKHRNPHDLARVVKRIGRMARPILLTDGLFAHDGSIAPLKLYQEILPTGSSMIVDDAHAAGVLGIHGRGTIEYSNLSNFQIVQTITLSKAFGAYGGAVLGTKAFCQTIRNQSRFYTGNTPLPLPLAASALEALHILSSDVKLRQRLVSNVRHVKNAVAQYKLDVPDNPSPVIGLEPKSERQTKQFKRELLKRGIYPPFLRYPNPSGPGLFRFALSSEHSLDQLNLLTDLFRDFRKCGYAA